MNLKKSLAFAFLLCAANAQAQEMNGFRTDNYNGVNGAFFNPANLGGSPFKLDVGIFGLNVYAGNKSQKFSFSTFSELGADSNSLNGLLGNGAPNSILANLALNLPSVSYSINDKLTIAFVSRSRLMLDVHDFDGTLVNSIQNSADKGSLPFTISNGTNMRINTNTFAEFGLSGAYNIYNSGNHFISAGATIKYLGGVANLYSQIKDLNATIDYDAVNDKTYLTNTQGTIAIGAGGVDLGSNSSPSFKFNAAGFGADLGLVYQYRPENLRDNAIPYLFKFGIALLDLGGIKYKTIQNSTIAYTANIGPTERFDLSAFDGKSLSEYKSVFNAYPQYFTPTSGLNNTNTYTVSLPRTLQINGDYRIINRVYVAANAQLAISNNESKPYNPKTFNSIAVTPRFESKLLAAYLPISYNNLSGMNMGFGFRAGPLYAGSSSILSGIFSTTKQADFYFGFRAGIKKRTKKAEDN